MKDALALTLLGFGAMTLTGCAPSDEGNDVATVEAEPEAKPAPLTYVQLGSGELPEESYERPPEVPFDKSDYVFAMENLTSFYDAPGELGYFMPGADYGFESLSVVVTETHPGGGPPLHTHTEEEAHVLLAGSMDYIIGEQRLSAQAPYIAKVPAGVPHTFVNAGHHPLNLVGVLASATPTYEPIGENPLVDEAQPGEESEEKAESAP